MYIYIYVCMYVCMYIYTPVYVYTNDPLNTRPHLKAKIKRSVFRKLSVMNL